jgi:hypothetical protein
MEFKRTWCLAGVIETGNTTPQLCISTYQLRKIPACLLYKHGNCHFDAEALPPMGGSPDNWHSGLDDILQPARPELLIIRHGPGPTGPTEDIALFLALPKVCRQRNRTPHQSTLRPEARSAPPKPPLFKS